MTDILQDLAAGRETVWLNPGWKSSLPGERINGYGFAYVKAAQYRFMRFLPWFVSAFPETAARKGVVESQLLEAPTLRQALIDRGYSLSGRLFLKDDAHLAIAGSVKARGGIHEVLKIAETLAQKAGMITVTDNYGLFDSPEFHRFFEQYTIQVGSTGNLGIAIGRTAAKFGFHAVVHMSREAKQWKKDLLRSEGVTVAEYDGDYSAAVTEGRRLSAADDSSFFVDDENSQDLFFGYSTAAMRLKVQLFKLGIQVDHSHPLFVYLPCGVGGAPAGITFGLRQLFGEHAHCFFAEPVQAPCFTLGMATGRHENIAVQEIGLTGQTIADGLAVSRPSGFACSMMETLMAGSFTVADEHLAAYRGLIAETEGLELEPSACAGLGGPLLAEQQDGTMETYINDHDLWPWLDQATHIVWATGGGLAPKTEQN